MPRAGVAALGLLVLLVTAGALRSRGASDRGGRGALAEARGGQGNISVAILIVGRTLHAESDGSPRPSAAFRVDARSILDTMTGEEDGAEVSLAAKPHHHHHDEANVSTWPSFKEHVLRPLRSSLGVDPDVFVCADGIVGAVPPEVTRVYSIVAENQYERAHLCYQQVLASRPYDFYIKVRPDFLFLKDLPDLAAMRRDRIHTRFRLAIGLRNLTSSHFSWNQCNKMCNGIPKSAFGYINDDMIWVVPAAVSGRVFASEPEAEYWRKRFKPPPNWLKADATFLETKFSKQLLAAGVSTEPLAVVGYPVNSEWNHKQSVVPCADKPIAKVLCGDHVTGRKP